MNYLTKILDATADRKSFLCGTAALDHYIKEQVTQDIRRRLAVCFILPDKENRIIGYYTLSNGSIPAEEIPEDLRKGFPKTNTRLPVTLLGRLAADQKYQGKGYGKLLLIDALRRSYETSLKSIGSIAVIVDAMDLRAERFYQKYGFVKLPRSGKMFLSMKTLSKLFFDHHF
jgi:GNAT superfamily N-acetyltransferase